MLPFLIGAAAGAALYNNSQHSDYGSRPFGQMFSPCCGQAPFSNFMQNCASGLPQLAMSALIPPQYQMGAQFLMGAGQLMQQLNQRLQYGCQMGSPYGQMGMSPYGQMGMSPYGQMGMSPYGQMGMSPYSMYNMGMQPSTLATLQAINSMLGRPSPFPFGQPSFGMGPQVGVSVNNGGPMMGMGPQVGVSVNNNGGMPYNPMGSMMGMGPQVDVAVNANPCMPMGSMNGAGTNVNVSVNSNTGAMPMGMGMGMPGGMGMGMPFGMGKPDLSSEFDQAMRVIDQNFGKLAHGGGTFNQHDLANAAQDFSNPQLAAACQWLLNNKMAFAGLDTASQQERGNFITKLFMRPDGEVGHNDMRSALAQTKNSVTDDATISVLQKYEAKIFGHAHKHRLRDRKDFENMANGGQMPNGEKAPPDLQAACRNLLADRALWDKIDSAQTHNQGWKRSGDNRISMRDLQIVSSKTNNNYVPAELQIPGGNYQQNPYQYPGAGFSSCAFGAMQNHLAMTGTNPAALNYMNQNASMFMPPYMQPHPVY
jgi:hypothetical protein